MNKFIAYFQPFSNTYDEVENLEPLYRESLSHPDVVGLSIGTRPDCVDDKTLDLIEELAQETHLWIEYGLQSMHDRTLDFINRGHGLKEFHDTYLKTKARKNIHVCVHIIHGFPGETREMMLDTVKYLSDMDIDGIKIHQLHVVKNTLMKRMYDRGEFTLPSLDEYLDLLAESLKLLPEKVVVQRLFGLGPLDLLVAPDWNLRKGQFNTLIDNYLDKVGCVQGSDSQFFNIVNEKYNYLNDDKKGNKSVKVNFIDSYDPGMMDSLVRAAKIN